MATEKMVVLLLVLLVVFPSNSSRMIPMRIDGYSGSIRYDELVFVCVFQDGEVSMYNLIKLLLGIEDDTNLDPDKIHHSEK